MLVENTTRISPFVLITESIRDFHNARGNAHLVILKDCKKKIKEEIKFLNKQGSYLEENKKNLHQQYQSDLIKALSFYIGRNVYMEISTIGNDQWSQLFSQYFKDSLQDLLVIDTKNQLSSFQVSAIREIVNQYDKQLTQLINNDFPGRKEISEQYYSDRSKILGEIKKIDNQLFIFNRDLDRCRLAIKELRKTTVLDFIFLAFGKSEKQCKVNNFTIGLFNEWDHIPFWFNEIITSAEKVNASQF